MTGRPCPHWCELTPGHDFLSMTNDGLRFSRGHQLELGQIPDHDDCGDVCVDIVATEEVDAADGLGNPTSTTPVLSLMSESAHLDAKQARAVAELLLAGADRLDAILGGL